MNKIKTYEDFVNEEINLRKAAAGLALGAGLAFGSPVVGQTTQTQTQQSSKQEDKINGLGDIKLGMSIEDVKSKFPDDESYYLNAQRTTYVIEVNNYKFDSDTYKAIFTFSNGTLNNISLELKGGGMLGFDESFLKSKFKEMESKFSKEYGTSVTDSKDKSKSWSKSDGTLSINLNDNKIFLKLVGVLPKRSEVSNVAQKSEVSNIGQTSKIDINSPEMVKMTDSEKFEVLRRELIQMKNDQTDVKLNLYKCHQEFKVGLGMVGAGLGLGILGYAQASSGSPSGAPIAIIGGVLSLAGSIVILDSHKFIAKASLTGIKVEFGGKPSYKKIEKDDYFLYMGPGQ
jgi:hypothetical protein